LQLLNEKVDSPHKLSLSVGVARFDPQNPVSLGELLSLADREMFWSAHVFLAPAFPGSG
jgi:hypothetical protein